mmetsp:Transcript_3771/g.5700  ORF Transcript_3771/g.5700 Transcript_3771/m.5700 type:complete len:93 (-) Transcript_3771:41-319(-)
MNKSVCETANPFFAFQQADTGKSDRLFSFSKTAHVSVYEEMFTNAQKIYFVVDDEKRKAHLKQTRWKAGRLLQLAIQAQEAKTYLKESERDP